MDIRLAGARSINTSMPENRNCRTPDCSRLDSGRLRNLSNVQPQSKHVDHTAEGRLSAEGDGELLSEDYSEQILYSRNNYHFDPDEILPQQWGCPLSPFLDSTAPTTSDHRNMSATTVTTATATNTTLHHNIRNAACSTRDCPNGCTTNTNRHTSDFAPSLDASQSLLNPPSNIYYSGFTRNNSLKREAAKNNLNNAPRSFFGYQKKKP